MVILQSKAFMTEEQRKTILKQIEKESVEPVLLLPNCIEAVNAKVLFECDRRACEKCNEECHLTADIRHAKNFKLSPLGIFIEN